MNVVVLRGTVARPVVRELGDGSSLLSFDVRATAADGRPASVPVAWFSPTVDLADGDEVVVTGEVRRRFFRGGGATASRTEVIAAEVVPARAKARARTAITRAVGQIAPAPA